MIVIFCLFVRQRLAGYCDAGLADLGFNRNNGIVYGYNRVKRLYRVVLDHACYLKHMLVRYSMQYLEMRAWLDKDISQNF